jgi:hypothetical protein
MGTKYNLSFGVIGSFRRQGLKNASILYLGVRWPWDRIKVGEDALELRIFTVDDDNTHPRLLTVTYEHCNRRKDWRSSLFCGVTVTQSERGTASLHSSFRNCMAGSSQDAADANVLHLLRTAPFHHHRPAAYSVISFAPWPLSVIMQAILQLSAGIR